MAEFLLDKARWNYQSPIASLPYSRSWIDISTTSITWSWPSLLDWTSDWVEQRPKAFDTHIDYSLPPMDVVVKQASGTLVKLGNG